jgi:hypothetical protein
MTPIFRSLLAVLGAAAMPVHAAVTYTFGATVHLETLGPERGPGLVVADPSRRLYADGASAPGRPNMNDS